ncbi:MAG: hypothetical protein IJ280_07145 [Bacteroidales bacterium]|nr:hypothetical protein [Bacteroidales bacterium]
MEYRLTNTGFLMNIKGSNGVTIKKLNTFDWLCDLPQAQAATDFVEVQFKNTRKGYYLNSNKIALRKGDWVAVESSPGHDIGQVSLTGQLVLKQMKKTRYRFDQEAKRIYRKARPADMEKYEESKAKEHDTMLRSRKIAEDLHLDMKIGDVEYQGDGNKAIFYYIADGRVDFRELIKVLADVFRIRIEMKQIGARQEAGRIGGIGPCGREMCCSAWMSNFVSVSTNAARCQDLSLNPQKLAGQCAKLKCCMNYEIDTYVEASRAFPNKDVTLETKDATYYQVKCDLLKKEITYSTSKDTFSNVQTITTDRAWQIIKLNRRGVKVESLSENSILSEQSAFGDILGQDVTRFDKPQRNKERRHKDRSKGNKNAHQGGKEQKARSERSERAHGERNEQNRNEQARSERNEQNRNEHRKHRDRNHKPRGERSERGEA